MHFTRVRNVVKAVYFLGCAVCFGYAVFQLTTGTAATLWIVGLVVGYTIRMFGVTCGLHRLATHQSFKTFGTVKAVLLIAAATAVQHIAKWVANHRQHHAFPDDLERDVHPPRKWPGILGWLYAQLLWFWSPLPYPDLKERVRRLHESDAELAFVDKTYPLWALLPFLVSFLVGGFAGTHFLRDGWYMFMWTNPACLFLTYTFTGFVNSFGHLHPHKRKRTKDYSQNFGGVIWPIMGLLTAGESYHGNHHDNQRMANLGRTPLQIAFDPGTWLLWTMERFGLIWDVRWSWKKSPVLTSR